MLASQCCYLQYSVLFKPLNTIFSLCDSFLDTAYWDKHMIGTVFLDVLFQLFLSEETGTVTEMQSSDR